jgi:Cu-Zn family superoxide dismutase
MRLSRLFLLVLALWATAAEAAPRPRAIARLAGLDGKPMGTADFRSVNRGVLISFDLFNLPPGPHGMHLHTAGNCDAKSGFTKAGPIWSLTPGRPHGFMAEGGGGLAGDLPNQVAGPDGRLRASVLMTGFNLGNGKRSIFDRDGVALIVKQRGDDYRTQPIGNAGNRIACGVVIRTVGPAKWKPPARK